MLLVIKHDKNPPPLANYSYMVRLLKKHNIPYISTHKIDPSIVARKDEIDAIIITGSSYRINPYSSDTGRFNHDLYYLHELRDKPVLGICHGCQVLTLMYGGNLDQHDELYCKRQITDITPTHFLFNHTSNASQLKLKYCFHDFPMFDESPTLPSGVKEIAWIDFHGKRLPCAFEFEHDKVFGAMFHPESHDSTYHILLNFYRRYAKSDASI